MASCALRMQPEHFVTPRPDAECLRLNCPSVFRGRISGVQHSLDSFAVRSVPNEPQCEFRRKNPAKFIFQLLEFLFA